MTAVYTLDIDHWPVASLDAGLAGDALAQLEQGRVLFLPRLSFELDSAERALVRESAAGAGGEARSKNVSYDPAKGALKGEAVADAATAALTALLDRFGRQAAGLLAALAPGYAAGLAQGRTSFRPAEIEGRALSWRKDDRRLHVDAFPSRPVRGHRILRVFSNINPDGEARRWRLGEPFEDHARRFWPRLRRPRPATAWAMQRLGLTRGRQSGYDQLMLDLHDAAKRDLAYQAEAETAATLHHFPPGSSWIVYTDQAPHAALKGRCALEQTFYVEPGVLAEPDRAPLAVLERLSGRRLV